MRQLIFGGLALFNPFTAVIAFPREAVFIAGLDQRFRLSDDGLQPGMILGQIANFRY